MGNSVLAEQFKFAIAAKHAVSTLHISSSFFMYLIFLSIFSILQKEFETVVKKAQAEFTHTVDQYTQDGILFDEVRQKLGI